MNWLVCKVKKDGSYFVCSRGSRESLHSYWQRNGIIVPSIVIRRFEERADAEKYLDNLKRVDNMLNRIL